MESSHSKISREKEKSHYFNKPNSTETLDRLVNPECSHYQEAYLDTGGNKGHSSKYSQSTDTFVTELLKNQNKELDEKLSQSEFLFTANEFYHLLLFQKSKTVPFQFLHSL